MTVLHPLCTSFLLPVFQMAQPIHVMPLLPDEWSGMLEANIAEKNYTLVQREFYSFSLGQARVETLQDDMRHIQLTDYNERLTYNVQELRSELGSKEWNCTVSSSNSTRDPNAGPMRHTAEMFQLSEDHTYEYQGNLEARGILCDVWSTHYENSFPLGPGMNKSLSMELRWFFAVQAWTVRGESKHDIPIRAELVGTDTTTGAGPQPIVKNIRHTYEFIDFFPNAGEPGLFFGDRPLVVDDDWGCPRANQRNKKLPKFARGYQALTSTSSVRPGKTPRKYQTTRYFDFPNQRIRVETVSAVGQIKVDVYDLSRKKNADDLHLSYFATPLGFNASAECKESVVGPKYEGAHPWLFDDHHDVLNLFNFADPDAATYLGQHTVGLIPVDLWEVPISEVDAKDGNVLHTGFMKMWFSADADSFANLPDDTMPRPVRVTIKSQSKYISNGTTFNAHEQTVDFFSFVRGQPGAHIFPTSCQALAAVTDSGGSVVLAGAGGDCSNLPSVLLVLVFVLLALGGLVAAYIKKKRQSKRENLSELVRGCSGASDVPMQGMNIR